MVRQLRAVVWVMLPAVVLATVGACATSRPRQRPVEGGRRRRRCGFARGGPQATRRHVEPGVGRGALGYRSADDRQGHGRPDLRRLRQPVTEGGVRRPRGDRGAEAALNFTGRAVIDTQKQVLRLLDIQQSEGGVHRASAEMAARRETRVRVRRRTAHADREGLDGRVTAVNTWRRQPK